MIPVERHAKQPVIPYESTAGRAGDGAGASQSTRDFRVMKLSRRQGRHLQVDAQSGLTASPHEQAVEPAERTSVFPKTAA